MCRTCGRRRIAGSDEERSKRVDRVYLRSTGLHHNARGLIESYNGSDLIARDASRESDRDPMATIKRVL